MFNSDPKLRLWDAAYQLWANTGLNPSKFNAPVLGLAFLRYAEQAHFLRHKDLAEADNIGQTLSLWN